MRISLFTTAGCHLCEQAFELLQRVSTIYSLDIVAVEIGDDDKLVQQYGIRIPVLQFEDGEELNWPFDEAVITQAIVNRINN